MSQGPEAPRLRAPFLGSERAQLAGWLDHERGALLDHLSRLDETALRRVPRDGPTNLLGIARHLTACEAHWFRGLLDGQQVDPPGEEPRPTPDAVAVHDVLHAYRAEIARSRMVLGRHELDRRVDIEGARVTTRWVVLRALADTARRRGQAEVVARIVTGPAGG